MDSSSDFVQNKSISIKLSNSERKIFDLSFSIKENKLEISIIEKSVIPSSYKAALELKDFQEINKFFRQFDNITEVLEFILSFENPEDKIKIMEDNKFINLDISLPTVSKFKGNVIKLKIPRVELKENELIVKICEQVKKIDALESKINFIFRCLGISEKDFILYEETMVKINKKIESSKIIEPGDFYPVAKGIKERLNKSIKDIKLLYRASRDGDGKEFHTKCDGKQNTVTFIKTVNNRKFGGFANREWDSNNICYQDQNAFLFSIDNNESYTIDIRNKYNLSNNNLFYIKDKNGSNLFYKMENGNNLFSFGNNRELSNLNNSLIFCSSNSGPAWGNNGEELYISLGCLSNKNSKSNRLIIDNKCRQIFLSGESNFQVEDYETYELMFE